MMNKRREYYKLWHEYLLESKLYEEFVEWSRKRIVENKKIQPPKVFKNSKKRGSHPFLFGETKYFALMDAYGYAFDEYWEFKKEGDRKQMDWQKKNLLIDAATFINKEIEDFVRAFSEDKGREPTFIEFKRNISKWMLFHELDHVYVINSLAPHSLKLIPEVVNEKETEYRRKFENKQGRSRLDQLKIYLDVGHLIGTVANEIKLLGKDN
jgi:hypothetical protein